MKVNKVNGLLSFSWNIGMWHIKTNVSVSALQWDRCAVAVDHGVVAVAKGFIVCCCTIGM